MQKDKTIEKTIIKSTILMIVIIAFVFAGAKAFYAMADETSQSEKHLVVKIIEDEELLEIDDYDVPLAFSFDTANEQQAGIRHVLLMSIMLACVIIYVIYQVINEKKIISLRRQAAEIQLQMMKNNRKNET